MRDLIRRVPRIQRLAVFESAARLGSFTGAAGELGMTQPAVTRQIRSLEQGLGVELFVRSSNRSELSPEGAALLRHVSDGFAAIESGLEAIGTRSDVFLLACPPGLAQQWLLPRLDQLQPALEGRDLRLWLFDQESELAGGGFHAAIRVGDGPFPGFESTRLFAETAFPVATPAAAERFRITEASPASALVDVPLLHMDDGDRPWVSWAEWFTHFGVPKAGRSGRVLFNNYPMVLQAAIAGRGVALGWRYLVDDLIADQILVPVGPALTTNRGYDVIWPEGTANPSVRALTAWLLAQVEQQPPPSTGRDAKLVR